MLLVRRRDISPSLSLARERVAIQTTVSPSPTAPLRVFCDCTVVPFLRAFLEASSEDWVVDCHRGELFTL